MKNDNKSNNGATGSNSSAITRMAVPLENYLMDKVKEETPSPAFERTQKGSDEYTYEEVDPRHNASHNSIPFGKALHSGFEMNQDDEDLTDCVEQFSFDGALLGEYPVEFARANNLTVRDLEKKEEGVGEKYEAA